MRHGRAGRPAKRQTGEHARVGRKKPAENEERGAAEEQQRRN